MELNHSEDSTGVTLDAILDIGAAERLKTLFQEAEGLRKKVLIDAAAVERLSTPCIQVMVAATRAFEAAGIEFALFRPSEAFVKAFDDLGLFSVLMTWKVDT